MSDHLTPVPGLGNPEPLPTAPTQLIYATCMAAFGCHPDAKLPVRAGQIVALQGLLEGVRKLLALSDLPEPEDDNGRELAQMEMDEVATELRTWLVGFEDELRREMHPNSKLTNEQVLEMRRLRAEGRKIDDLAELFGITRSNVGLICQGKTWRHLLSKEAA